MTDLQRFESFFKEMGIGFHPRPKRVTHFDKGAIRQSTTFVSVTQNHFHFDRDGRYLGAEADEMGYFVPRLSPEGK